MTSSKSQSIVGYSDHRSHMDFYPTPPTATETLFQRETFEGQVWEPASGDGSMSKVIEKHNECISSDIQKGDWIYGEKGVDFLLEDRKASNIITNPPYNLAEEFIKAAKRQAKKKIAMLLKLVFLEGKRRQEMFLDQEFPLKTVYVFSKRIQFGKGGSPTLASAWYVWDKSYKGKPQIEWI